MPRAEKIKRQMSQILKRVTFPLLLLLILLVAGDQAPRPFKIVSPVFAAGGTCPSGANYLNPSNPTGALVTLAGLGITNCYYISAAGADTNNGTSESTPWLHAPMMANCSSTCAAVNVSQGTQLAGTGFIFRGGDTWHFGNNTGDYTGGVWEWNPSSGGPSGTSSNLIYIGVDSTWYTGGSWVRPIFTADNPLCNLSNLSGTCIQNTNGSLDETVYVTSCPYQIAANSGKGTNDILEFGNQGYFIIDNFEMTGLCQSDTGQPSHQDDYVSYGSLQATVTFEDLYIHGWSHLQFAGNNGSGACAGAVCMNIFAFSGGVNGSPGENILDDVVDGSDSDAPGGGLCFGGFYNAAYNVFRYTSQCIIGTHLFHDNLYEYFYENGHSNVLEEIADPAGTNAIYDNVFRHLEISGGTGGVGLWPLPPSGTTDYIFNNLMYDVGNMEIFNIGNSGSTAGNYTVFNNTFQANNNQSILNCQYLSGGALTDTNNFFIDNGTQYSSPCNNKTTTTALLLTNAQATSDGYTASETYAYSPTSASSPTVGSGTNENTAYCGALTTAGLTAAAAACQSDTTYACIYNSTSHTVTCPARTAVLRPTSAAWDVGAYQFTIVPLPGSNAKATAY